MGYDADRPVPAGARWAPSRQRRCRRPRLWGSLLDSKTRRARERRRRVAPCVFVFGFCKPNTVFGLRGNHVIPAAKLRLLRMGTAQVHNAIETPGEWPTGIVEGSG